MTKLNVGGLIRQLYGWAAQPNIASLFKEDYLKGLGQTVHDEYSIDKNSRGDWEKSARAALETVGCDKKGKSYPFQGASEVKYPLLTTAVLQFAARAYPAIVQPPKIVKAQINGTDVKGEKKAIADRVSAYMSFQLLTEMKEWDEDTDTLLHVLPAVGCAFRKVYRSQANLRNYSELISAFDLVVNQKTRTLSEAPRATHIIELYPYEIEERVRAGTFISFEYDTLVDKQDTQAPIKFLEQHRRHDLDGDGYAEPVIITICEETKDIVRIAANYDPNDIYYDEEKIVSIPANEYFVKYSFIPDPKGGFYGIGFGKLLESISGVIDSSLNQMMDAGHLQNAGGGFIGSGLKLKKDRYLLEPGVYHTVNTPGPNIEQAIYHHQHPGPSPVLFQLLGMMVDAGEKVASISDVLTGDVHRNQPASTTLALIEQGLKVFTAIYKRIYRSLTKEFQLLFLLNRKHFDIEKYLEFHDHPGAGPGDFDDDFDVVPVADPAFVTDMQKLGRAQLLLDISQDPLINREVALRRFLEAAHFTGIDELIAQPQPDPAQELQATEMEAKIEKTGAETQKIMAETAEKEISSIEKGLSMIGGIDPEMAELGFEENY